MRRDLRTFTIIGFAAAVIIILGIVCFALPAIEAAWNK